MASARSSTTFPSLTNKAAMAAIIPIRWSPKVSKSAPCKGVGPVMIIPSSVGTTLAPIALRLYATTWMRSVSFTRSSSASAITVWPFACVASKAIIGNSSIKRGINSPSIRIPFKDEVLTVRLAETAFSSRSSMVRSPPIPWMTSRIPVRVWLMPTCSILITLFGRMSPATNQKAALEISPGTMTVWPWNSCPPWMRMVFPSTWISPPNWRIISSVWSRVFSFSIIVDSPSACRAAKMRADLTWADATGKR